MLALAEATGTSFRSLTAGLTAVSCECCGQIEVDEVAHVLIEEAVILFARACEAKAESDAGAWAEAEAAVAAAQAARA